MFRPEHASPRRNDALKAKVADGGKHLVTVSLGMFDILNAITGAEPGQRCFSFGKRPAITPQIIAIEH
jgi:hypothetical protein